MCKTNDLVSPNVFIDSSIRIFRKHFFCTLFSSLQFLDIAPQDEEEFMKVLMLSLSLQQGIVPYCLALVSPGRKHPIGITRLFSWQI